MKACVVVLLALSVCVRGLQICGNSKDPVFVEPPSIRNCAESTPHPDTLPEKFRSVLFVKRRSEVSQPSYVCSKILSEYTTESPLVGKNFDIFNGQRTEDVPVNICNEMIDVAFRNHSAVAGKPWTLVKYDAKQQLFDTAFTPDMNYTWLSTTRNVVVDYQVRLGTVSSMNGHDLRGDFGESILCTATTGVCKTDTATVIWNGTQFHQKLCPFKEIGLVEAVRQDRHVIIAERNLAVTFYHGRLVTDPCLDSRAPAYEADQGNVVLTLPDFVQTELKLLDSESNETDDNALMKQYDQFNAKYQFIYYQVMDNLKSYIAPMWQQICQLDAAQMRQAKQLLIMDPTAGVRMLMQDESYAARWLGDALTMWRCTQVTADKIYLDGEVNGECYRYLPVEVNGVLYFQVPGMQDLVTSAPQMDCNHRLHFIRKTEDGFYETGHGSRHSKRIVAHELPTSALSHYSSTDFAGDFVFTARPLYDEPVIPMSSSIQNHHLMQQRALNGKVDRVVGVLSHGAFHRQGFLSFVQGNILKPVGAFANAAWDGVEQLGATLFHGPDLLGWLFGSISKWWLWVVVIVCSVLVIALLLYTGMFCATVKFVWKVFYVVIATLWDLACSIILFFKKICQS